MGTAAAAAIQPVHFIDYSTDTFLYSPETRGNYSV